MACHSQTSHASAGPAQHLPSVPQQQPGTTHAPLQLRMQLLFKARWQSNITGVTGGVDDTYCLMKEDCHACPPSISAFSTTSTCRCSGCRCRRLRGWRQAGWAAGGAVSPVAEHQQLSSWQATSPNLQGHGDTSSVCQATVHDWVGQQLRCSATTSSNPDLVDSLVVASHEQGIGVVILGFRGRRWRGPLGGRCCCAPPERRGAGVPLRDHFL